MSDLPEETQTHHWAGPMALALIMLGLFAMITLVMIFEPGVCS